MPSRLAISAVLLLILAGHAMAGEHTFTPAALVGVWEVVACESMFQRQANDPVTMPNFKYCFGDGEAYPELSADAANDSADGGGEYHVVGGDILVIRTGAPNGLYAFELIEVGPKQIVWREGSLRVTLRRFAAAWDGRHASKLRPREVSISYPR